jgi:predicted nucleic acid-binding protein
MVAPVTISRIYLDANVFIAAYESQTARSDHAWWVLNAVEEGEFVGVTSELTLAEILVKPIEEGDDDMVRRYKEVITPGRELDVLTVDRQILIEAAVMRTMRRSLKLPDAIHVASAHRGKCAHMISDDRRLPFAPGLEVVQLGPYSLDILRGAYR